MDHPLIPFEFRNVINPGQTDGEILNAVKSVDKVLRRVEKQGRLTPEYRHELLRSNQPRRWIRDEQREALDGLGRIWYKDTL